MNTERLDKQIEEIRGLLRQKLGVRGKTLAVQVRRAGRALPKTIRVDAARLIEARTMMQSPKLSRMIDTGALADAHRAIVAHLETIDPRERRKDRILGILSVLAFNVLLFGAGLVTWLVWTDRV